MGTLLKWVGLFWAIVGVANIVMMPWGSGRETLLGYGLMLNFGVYILPGLVVAGIGSGLNKKQDALSPAAPAAARKTTEDRLNDLASLKSKGLIDEAEYDTRRASILREV